MRQTMLGSARCLSAITRPDPSKVLSTVKSGMRSRREAGGLMMAGVAAALFAGHFPARAQAALSDTDKAAVRRIENYLSSVETLESHFVQTNEDGSYATGKLHMHRPGRMRIDYDDPVPYLIVATGTLFIFVDYQLKEVTHLPLVATPAELLLRNPIRLGDDVGVRRVLSEGGLLRITLFHKDSPDSGEVTMIFEEDPMRLRQWQIIDAQGTQTLVTLTDPEFGLPQAPELFKFDNPWSRREGGN